MGKFLERNWLFCKLILVLIVTNVLIGCKKEKEPPVKETPIVNNRVFVVNEGTFQSGNASLGIYDKSMNSYYPEVFINKNGVGIGDIFQSMLIEEDKAYLCVNNSNTIIAMDIVNYNKLQELNAISSPRYIIQVSSSKAYVSSLWDHNLTVVDLNSLSISGYIAMPGWTEEMIRVDNNVWVTSVNTSAVYLVNTQNDLVMDSIVVGDAPKNLVQDKNGKLWVLSGQFDSPTGRLTRINPQSKSIETSFNLPITQNMVADRLKINGQKDTLYFLYNGVTRMDITSNVMENILPLNHFMMPYGLSIDPHNSDIYVADAMDFVQEGFLMRFSQNVEILDSIRVGNVPSDFYFE